VAGPKRGNERARLQGPHRDRRDPAELGMALIGSRARAEPVRVPAGAGHVRGRAVAHAAILQVRVGHAAVRAVIGGGRAKRLADHPADRHELRAREAPALEKYCCRRAAGALRRGRG